MTSVEEVDIFAIGHKGEGAETLALLQLFDIKFCLSLGQTRIYARPFCFYNSDNLAIWAIQYIVTDASRKWRIKYATAFFHAVELGLNCGPCLWIRAIH